MHFSAAKAVRELDLPQTPVDAALAEAVQWFVEHGYAPPPPRLARAGGRPARPRERAGRMRGPA
jgi:hypothetical protein